MPKKIRVILGAEPLLVEPLTGIGQYTTQLARGILEDDNISDLKLFAHDEFIEQKWLNGQVNSPNVGKNLGIFSLFSTIKKIAAKSSTIVALYETFRSHIAKYRLHKYKNDYIFHSPYFILPAFAGKKIVTLHDLSTLLLPEFHLDATLEYLNSKIPKAVLNADHIITDSEFVRREVIEYFALPETKVSSIHLGADNSFYPRTETQCSRILSRYGLKYKRYFLFVSTIEPRKNIERLLSAHDRYWQDCDSPMPLILIGSQGWKNEHIHERISQLEKKGAVKYFGYIEQSYLPLVYSAARALFYPSIYEGFGLPVLEAMQSGTAVLTSENSSMSEVAGEAALLVNPLDIDNMVESIKRLHSNDAYVEELVIKGIKQSAKFSWNRCVEKTILLYKKVLAEDSIVSI